MNGQAEARALVRDLEKDGWMVTITGREHYRAVGPNGEGPVFIAQTPSGSRFRANMRALIRRVVKSHQEGDQCPR